MVKIGTKTLFYLRKYTPNEISDAKFGHLRNEIEVEGVKLYIFAPTMTQHVQRHAYCLLGGKWIISFSGSLQILCHNADNIHDGVRVKFKFYTNVIGTKCKERILSVPYEPLMPQTFSDIANQHMSNRYISALTFLEILVQAMKL